MLPDVPALDRPLDYVLPPALADGVEVGTVVRIPLHGRRVRGWVLELDSRPPDGVRLLEVAKVTGAGPPAELIELCRWVAQRWVGRAASVLRIATGDAAVPLRAAAPPDGPARRGVSSGSGGLAGADADAARLLDDGGLAVLQVPPTRRLTPLALAAAARGQALVITPSVAGADYVAGALRAAGVAVARWPGGAADAAAARAGATVVGGRSAAVAPAPALRAVVVWDEHDEGLQQESSPTWHARDVAVERARRAGVPCLVCSPCPSLEARALGPVQRPPRGEERAGWAAAVVVDRRADDVARGSLASTAFVAAAREELDAGGRVVCVLNRTGRARMLACRSCRELATCTDCAAAVGLDDDRQLVCGRCGATRPPICASCGATALAQLRLGVTRAREELEALLRVDVGAVTAQAATGAGAGAVPDGGDPGTPVVVGTAAALHRVRGAGLVAFLDLDQELLATRYRAAEEALALVVLASRVVGGRSGRVLVQTRRPDHEVVRALVRADPDLVADAEAVRRRVLRLPPAAAVALVGGPAAPTFVERLGHPSGVEVLGPTDGAWVVRAADRAVLADVLGAVARPPGTLRLRVDPLRLR